MYELTYIINPDLTEEQISELKGKINNFIIEQEGEIKEERKELKMKLAYPIKKFNFGCYASVDFNIEPQKLLEFEKKLKPENNILRYLMIFKEKETPIERVPVKPAKEKKIKEKVKIEELDQKLEELLKE